MRMFLLPALCLAPLLLSGCGVATEVKDTATAPVDNMQRNINYMQDTKKELRELGKKRSDEANQQVDDILKKK
jgi:hypothetical protein